MRIEARGVTMGKTEEGEGEREKKKQRQTDRQTDRETETERRKKNPSLGEPPGLESSELGTGCAR